MDCSSFSAHSSSDNHSHVDHSFFTSSLAYPLRSSSSYLSGTVVPSTMLELAVNSCVAVAKILTRKVSQNGCGMCCTGAGLAWSLRLFLETEHGGFMFVFQRPVTFAWLTFAAVGRPMLFPLAGVHYLRQCSKGFGRAGRCGKPK